MEAGIRMSVRSMVSAMLFLCTMQIHSGSLSGIIIDENHMPVVNAVVSLLPAGVSTTTDYAGEYLISQVIPGTYAIHVLSFGFRPVVDTVSVGEDPVVIPPIVCRSLVAGIGYERHVPDSLSRTATHSGAEYIRDLPAMNDVYDYIDLLPGTLRSRDGLHMRGGAAGELKLSVDDVSMRNLLSTHMPIELPAEILEFSRTTIQGIHEDMSASNMEVCEVSTVLPRNRIHAAIRYRTTTPGLNEVSGLLDERSLSGVIAGPFGIDSRGGFLLAARVKRSDDYHESGKRGPLGFPTGESTGESFGFDDSDALYALTRWSPVKGTMIQLSYIGYHRRWKPYDHDFRYIPDSSSVHDSRTDIIGATLARKLSSSVHTRIRGTYQRFAYRLNHAGLGFREYAPGIGIRDRNGEFLLYTDEAPFSDEELVSLSGDVEVQWRPTSQYMISGGGEYTRHFLSFLSISGIREDTVNDVDVNPRETALFLQARYMSRQFTLQGGIRLQSFDPDVAVSPVFSDNERNERDADTVRDVSPRITATWRLSKSFAAHVSHCYSARWPILEFLYEGLGRELSELYPLIGDDDMKPAKSRVSEIGVSYVPVHQLVIRAAAFRKNVDSLLGLSRFSIAGCDSAVYQFTGSNESDITGTECEFVFRRNGFVSRVGYAYQIADGRWSLPRVGDSIDEWASRAAYVGTYILDTDRRHTVKGLLVYTTGERPVGMELLDTLCRHTVLSVTGEYGSGLPYTSASDPVPNSVRLPETITFDARVARYFSVGSVHASVTVEVTNLFDRKNAAVDFPSAGLDGHEGAISQDYAVDPSLYAEPRIFHMGISFRH